MRISKSASGVIENYLRKISLFHKLRITAVFSATFIFLCSIVGCAENTLFLSPESMNQPVQSAQMLPQSAPQSSQFEIEPPEISKKPIAIADEKFKEYIVGTWSSNHSSFFYSITKVNGNVIQTTDTRVILTKNNLTFNADKTIVFKSEVSQPVDNSVKTTECFGSWEVKNSQLCMKMNSENNQGSYQLIADIIWLNQDTFVMKYDPDSYTKMLESMSAQVQYPAGVTNNIQYRYYYASSGFSYTIMQHTSQANGYVSETTIVTKTERMLYSKVQAQSAVFAGTPVVPMVPPVNNAAVLNNQLAPQPMQQTVPQQVQPAIAPQQMQQPVSQQKQKPEVMARPFFALGRIICSPLNIIGFTSVECQKIKSDSSFMYAFVPIITIPAGILAMSGDVVVGCLELLTFQAFDVRYPWESFKPSKGQNEIINFTTSLLSVAAVATAYGAANYASTYSAVKAANASTPQTVVYSGGSSSKGPASAVISNKEERRECNVCHTKYWGASCPSCKYRVNYW